MKKVLILLFFMASTAVFAQNSSDIKVSTKAIAGCQLRGDDFNMGVLSGDLQGVNGNLEISCSKGTILTLSASSKNNPSGSGGFWLFNNKTTSKKNGLYMPYALKTTNIVSTEFFQLLQTPKENTLNKYFSSGFDYTMKIKILTERPAVLTFLGRIELVVIGLKMSNIEAGDYSDTATYTVTF